MKISVNTIREMNKRFGCAGEIAPDGVDELAKRIGAQLGAIEEIIGFGSKYQGVLLVRVVACEQHPNADKLKVCTIDDGGVAAEVKRDVDGNVQVVCGASNVRAGMTAAWLPPGSTVPQTAGKDPSVLEARELRGIVSNGMLASARELALGDDHDGILELTASGDEQPKPGMSFAEAYHLTDDAVIDIENKMFTHRPDCFGFLGVARELAGIRQMAFKSPEWYRRDAPFPDIEAEPLALEVRNEIPELVPRFLAVALRDVEIKPSPVWLQLEMAKMGLKSINNIVDYTNFFMLETGQPIHAYDYDKVKALSGGDYSVMEIRNPREGEQITLLNGKTITPRKEAMMVATDNQLICLGGAIGGSETEVDEHTTNIIIEAANWDMYAMRRTAMEHGIFTDAVTRFTKGQSPLQNRAVIARIVDEIRRSANGKVASELIDDIHLRAEVTERGSVHPPVTLTVEFINSRLGLRLSAEEIKKLLENVEFDVQTKADSLTVAAPFWRTDIEIPEDIVEEAGRLYGFDRLPLELPKRAITPAPKNELLELKQQVREVLSRAGANEVLTYSFVHGKLLERAGQNPEHAFRLSNALSPDLQYYRQSLTPSLLDKVHPNIKAGYDEFALFEIGKGHNLLHKDDDDGLPGEFEMLDLIYAAKDRSAVAADDDVAGAAFYQAKKFLEALAAAFGLELAYVSVDPATDYPVTKPYDLSRSALVSVKTSGDFLGMVGEFRPEVIRNFKLPRQTAAFGIGLRELLAASRNAPSRYTPLPRFPKVEQDICLRVAADLPYQLLFDFVEKQLQSTQPDNVLCRLSPVDIYQRPYEPSGQQSGAERKQITLRLTIASYDKTLRDSEVASLLDRLAASAQKAFQAERI